MQTKENTFVRKVSQPRQVVETPANLAVTENDLNSNTVPKPVVVTAEVVEPKVKVEKPVEVELTDVQKAELKARKDYEKAEKFNYIVAEKVDGGPLKPFENSGIMFYGTLEDAEGLWRYASLREKQNFVIIKIKV